MIPSGKRSFSKPRVVSFFSFVEQDSIDRRISKESFFIKNGETKLALLATVSKEASI